MSSSLSEYITKIICKDRNKVIFTHLNKDSDKYYTIMISVLGSPLFLHIKEQKNLTIDPNLADIQYTKFNFLKYWLFCKM